MEEILLNHLFCCMPLLILCIWFFQQYLNILYACLGTLVFSLVSTFTLTEYGFLPHRFNFKHGEIDLFKMKETLWKRLYVMLPRLSSHPLVSVTVVSVKRETLMSLWPFISIMHHLTAVGFILTATSLCALGIKSKCCDQSHQLVEQTATAHRAEKAVSSKSQLIFSCTTLTTWFLFTRLLHSHTTLSQR